MATKKKPTPRNLEATLQALYDSEFNVTIHWIWDGGVDFGFIAWPDYAKSTAADWHHVHSIADLAEAIHVVAITLAPDSKYARQNG